jgi:hypothetical protein
MRNFALTGLMSLVMGCGTAAPEVSPYANEHNKPDEVELVDMCETDCGKLSFADKLLQFHGKINILNADNWEKYTLKENAHQPIPSPDGEKLIFENEEGYMAIMTSSGDHISDTDILVMTHNTSSLHGHYQFVSGWDSDSSSFVYTTNPLSESWQEVHVFDIESKKDSLLELPEEWGAANPTRCGDKIVFRVYDKVVFEDSSVKEMNLIHSDGSTSLRVYREESDEESEFKGIYSMNSDSSDITQLTNYGHYPKCSPKGDLIAFQNGDHSNGINLWVMESDGSNPRQITYPLGDKTELHEDAQWGQNHTLLFDVTKRRQGNSWDYKWLRTVNLNFGEQKILADIKDHPGDATLSPNGELAAYEVGLSTKDTNRIEIARLSDGYVLKRVKLEDPISTLHWSP